MKIRLSQLRRVIVEESNKEARIAELIGRYKNNREWVRGVKNDFEAMAAGEDAGGVRTDYYLGWDNDDFQRVIDGVENKGTTVEAARVGLSHLRRVIAEEVRRSLRESAGGSTAQKLQAMFGAPEEGQQDYAEAAAIIDETLADLDGLGSPVSNPRPELESALSMTPAGDAPGGGIDRVMDAFFAGETFDAVDGADADEDFTPQQIALDIIHSGLLADADGDAEDAVDAYLGSTDRESVLNPDEIVRAVWEELLELKGKMLPTSYPLRVVEYTNARGEKRTIETQRPLQTIRRLTFTGFPNARVVS